MLAAMTIAGVLVSDIVSRGALKSRAAATALLVQSLVSPLIQELRTSNKLSDAAIAKLDRLYADEAFGHRFPYLEIWTPDGTIAYSNSPMIIGQYFKAPVGLSSALAGEVTSEYADLNAREHTVRGIGIRYLEIYNPIREDGSGRIIGVAEIHENTAPLREDLMRLRMSAWAVVAISTLVIMVGLFGIVRHGSRMIETQSSDLKRHIEEIEELARLNRNLMERSQRASARVTEINEQFMRNIGADLHDGPAQLVSFSLLRIDAAHRARTSSARKIQFDQLRSALSEALRDLRSIARGLLLPDIADQSFNSILERVVSAHEARTSAVVALSMSGKIDPLSQAVKICAFRFVQEGLNNAYRHGNSAGQRVDSWMEETRLHVAVSDEGNNSPSDERGLSEGGLGLHGLRERIESLGGTLTMKTRATGGITLEMAIDLSGGLRVG